MHITLYFAEIEQKATKCARFAIFTKQPHCLQCRAL